MKNFMDSFTFKCGISQLQPIAESCVIIPDLLVQKAFGPRKMVSTDRSCQWAAFSAMCTGIFLDVSSVYDLLIVPQLFFSGANFFLVQAVWVSYMQLLYSFVCTDPDCEQRRSLKVTCGRLVGHQLSSAFSINKKALTLESRCGCDIMAILTVLSILHSSQSRVAEFGGALPRGTLEVLHGTCSFHHGLLTAPPVTGTSSKPRNMGSWERQVVETKGLRHRSQKTLASQPCNT